MDQETAIKSISVLDGRYQRHTAGLEEIFSEYGLIRCRVFVELEWFKFLLREVVQISIDKEESDRIDGILRGFDLNGALAVKSIEKQTNHDVKAAEYYIKEKLIEVGLGRIREWVHFGCTSDDINNTAYALMVKGGRDLLLENLGQVTEKIESLGWKYRDIAMMARTHGQPATPTTVGKEFINFAWRLRHEINALKNFPVQAKMNGASGNYNAHHFVFPETDWIEVSARFLRSSLGLSPVLYTTQVNPNNYLSAILHCMVRAAAVITDLDRDMWGYISLGYFKQKLKESEVGSSTMPHKVNPIDFENSEGNAGLAISMMEHMAVKLMISRYQRDLSDSTVLRNLGAVFGYMLIALRSTLKGLDRIEVDKQVIQKDLEANPELLAEPLQSAMRACGESEPYEKLKTLTRGRRITRNELVSFVEGLESVSEDMRENLKNLEVTGYTGLAEVLVERYFKDI